MRGPGRTVLNPFASCIGGGTLAQMLMSCVVVGFYVGRGDTDDMSASVTYHGRTPTNISGSRELLRPKWYAPAPCVVRGVD